MASIVYNDSRASLNLTHLSHNCKPIDNKFFEVVPDSTLLISGDNVQSLSIFQRLIFRYDWKVVDFDNYVLCFNFTIEFEKKFCLVKSLYPI